MDRQQSTFKDSAPCIDCMKIIRSLKIKKIVYSTDDAGFTSVKPDNYTIQHETLGRRLLDIKRKNTGTQVKSS
jgi:hypothetical protein